MSANEEIDSKEVALREKYNKETGKNAIWRGKLSNPYINWKKQELEKNPVKKEMVKKEVVKKKEPVKKEVVKKKEPVKKEVVKKKEPVKKEAVKKKVPVKKEVVKKKEPVKKEVVKNKEPVKKEVVEKKEPVKKEVVKKKEPVKMEMVKKEVVKKKEPVKKEMVKKEVVKKKEPVKKEMDKKEVAKKKEPVKKKTKKNKSKPKKDESQEQSDPADNPVWQFFKPFLPQIGKWSWLVLLALGTLFFILWNNIFGIVSYIILLAITLLWVMPTFSHALMEERYEDLLNTTFNVSNIRIPQMIVYGILLSIFSYGVGLIILIPAVVLIFFSAYIPYSWNVKKNN